jgi:hypothetical protein
MTEINDFIRVKRPTNPIEIRTILREYAIFYRENILKNNDPEKYAPPKGILGATIGLMNKSLGDNQVVRRLVLGYIFLDDINTVREMHTEELNISMKRAIIAWVTPTKDVDGGWDCDGDFKQEVVRVANLALTLYNSHSSVRILEQVNKEAVENGFEYATDGMVLQALLLGGKITKQLEYIPPKELPPDVMEHAIKPQRANAKNIASLI